MIKLNQKKMKVTYKHTGELNNGDIIQCPFCRKKYVVVPGAIQHKIDGGADVFCAECALPMPLSYYESNPPELPAKRTRKKEASA